MPSKEAAGIRTARLLTESIVRRMTKAVLFSDE